MRPGPALCAAALAALGPAEGLLTREPGLRAVVFSCPARQASANAGDWKPQSLWVGFRASARLLRSLGCELPIYNLLDEDEFAAAASPCRDLAEGPDPINNTQCLKMARTGTSGYGYTKIYAIRDAPADQVLFFDCDAFPVADPTLLFNSTDFLRTGALFWPDIEGHFLSDGHWKAAHHLFPTDRRGLLREWWAQQGLDTGLLLVDKVAWARPLSVLLDMVEGASGQGVDWGFQDLDALSSGDKDLWHLAWLLAGEPCREGACSLAPCAAVAGAWQGDRLLMTGQAKLGPGGELLALHQIWRTGEDRRPVPAELLARLRLPGRRSVAGNNDLLHGFGSGSISRTELEQQLSEGDLQPLPAGVAELVARVAREWEEGA
mmetsp:Transcript_9126/g.26974  ORF Transcript_9126/g.26974 Transcript_9126/m.26974 type:complete len:377 (+) Transcript_9126:78-1208(+)